MLNVWVLSGSDPHKDGQNCISRKTLKISQVNEKKRKKERQTKKIKMFGNKNIQYFKILVVPIVDSAVNLM